MVSESSKGSMFIEFEFRNWVFVRAYIRAGSLAEIANHFHYAASGGKNGAIRDMWLGKKGVPAFHTAELAGLAEISLDELEKHRVQKPGRAQQLDWIRVVLLYQKNPSMAFREFSRALRMIAEEVDYS